MALDYSTGMSSSGVGDDILQQAGALERLAQRLLIAEQSAFQREVSRFNLTVPQYVTLAAIEGFAGSKERMGRIAQTAHQCSATMTGIIDRLEAMGLVKRDNNPQDRRSVLVELTDAGRAKIEEVRAARRQRLASLLVGIEPDMRMRFYEVLQRYADALEAGM